MIRLLICYAILLFLAGDVHGRQYDIYLKQLPFSRYRMAYIFERPEDSIYLRVRMNNDSTYAALQLREVLPDGLYRVFINRKVHLSGSVKNNRKEGLWQHKLEKGDWEIHTYRDGEPEGLQAIYDSNFHLLSFAWVSNGYQPVTTQYGINGKVQRHIYDMGDGPELVQDFDAQGYLLDTRETSYNNCKGEMLQMEAAFEKGKLNGISKLHTLRKQLEIEYKDNEIIRWQLIRYSVPEQAGLGMSTTIEASYQKEEPAPLLPQW